MPAALLVAFHFPPLLGSSGVHRAAAFARHLPSLGWTPLVLTVDPAAYPVVDARAASAPPMPGAIIRRTRALDTTRHLAVAGRHPGWLALPDRWVSWLATAVPAAMALARRHRPRALWSTYPIATAHLVAAAVHRLTGIPWVADLRDPMHDELFPYDRRLRRVHEWIERHVASAAAAVTVTTPGTRALLAERHPGLGARLRVIPNGYDEAAFAAVRTPEPSPDRAPGVGAARPFTLLHAGVLYPRERDPEALFSALAVLKRRGVAGPGRLRTVLRATGHDEYLRARIAAAGLEDVVELAPAVPHAEALAEMSRVDALLLLQAASCNHQIPAKAYEYLRAGRPIVALTDPAGDTAGLLREAGAGCVVGIDDARGIETALEGLLEGRGNELAPPADPERVAAYERSAGARALASLLAEVSGG